MLEEHESEVVEEQLHAFLAGAEKHLSRLREELELLYVRQDSYPWWDLLDPLLDKWRYARVVAQVDHVLYVTTKVRELIPVLSITRRSELITRLLDLGHFDDGNGLCSHLNPCFHLTLACWVLHKAPIPGMLSVTSPQPCESCPTTE